MDKVALEQTKETFNKKWEWWPKFSEGYVRTQLEWLVKKMGMKDLDELFDFWKSKKRMCDVGVGNGYAIKSMSRVSPEAQIVGIDINAERARENVSGCGNVEVIEASILEPPARLFGQFDFVMSEGVLNFTGDMEKAIANCAKLLAPGGTLMVHVYHKGTVPRELMDDHLREIAGSLKAEECLEWCKQFTNLGKVLFEQKVDVTIPDVPALGWKAGTFPLQEFVFYHMVRCFWDWQGTSSFDECNLDQFDWYAPMIATRHTTEELVRWAEKAGLMVVKTPKANRTGAAVVAIRQ